MPIQIKPTPLDRLAVRMVYATHRRGPFVDRARQILRLVGVDIPPETKIGPHLMLLHVGAGHTVHWNTTLGARVLINPGVVIGRANLTEPNDPPVKFVVGDDVIFGANSVILGKGGRPITIGSGAVIGAGAVVNRDVGPGEVWAGNPARRVR